MEKYFQIDRGHIVLVQFIIEGYERMATVTTIDAKEAVIRVTIMTDYIAEISGLLEYLKTNYNMKDISDYQKSKR